MPAITLRSIARDMFRRSTRTARRVEDWESELYRIFTGAEKALYAQRAEVLGGLPVENGVVSGSPEALAQIETLLVQVRELITGSLVTPGLDWADATIPAAFQEGRDLARINLALIDRETVRQAFLNIQDAEAGVLRVGLQDTYQVLRTAGDDVAEFFRREFVKAATLGLPIQARGDAPSLAKNLYEGGYLKPITVRTKDGKIITRSVRQRAITIARVETAKVGERVHEIKTQEVLGESALYANANPEDSRTTDVCMRASRLPPMALREWDAHPLGRPPRIFPQFHLCRSFLIGGTSRMFSESGHPAADIDRGREDA